MKKCIEKQLWNQIFNAVAPFHPSKKEYYTQKAIELGLQIPVFNDNKFMGKIVSSEKVERVLEYKFVNSIL